MEQFFYFMGSRCFRIGKFLECGSFRIGNVVFVFHDIPALGIYRDTGKYVSCFFGILEVLINEQTKD